jgi:hypothetical protein
MTARVPDFEMLDPWILIESDRAKLLEAELTRELRSDHVLSGTSFEAVAMSTMTDDVLFITDSARGSLAHVHLTWSGKPDQHPNWPWTEFYHSWAQFRDSEMIPMHENTK